MRSSCRIPHSTHCSHAHGIRGISYALWFGSFSGCCVIVARCPFWCACLRARASSSPTPKMCESACASQAARTKSERVSGSARCACTQPDRVQLQAAELVAYGRSNAGAVTPHPPAQQPARRRALFFSKDYFILLVSDGVCDAEQANAHKTKIRSPVLLFSL